MYSLPGRGDEQQHFDSIPLRDFNQPQQNERIERVEQKETKKRRKYNWSVYALGALLFITTILSLVFAALYFSNLNKPPETPKNSTVVTSILTTTTSIPGKASTRTQTLPPVTQTLPPVTQTLPPVTQTTVHTETEVSHTTIEITETLVLTITDTTSITACSEDTPGTRTATATATATLTYTETSTVSESPRKRRILRRRGS